jgi:hypothetical protein
LITPPKIHFDEPSEIMEMQRFNPTTWLSIQNVEPFDDWRDVLNYLDTNHIFKLYKEEVLDER